MLGCARERQAAKQNAYKGDDKINTKDSGSKYLDRKCKDDKKLCQENSCDDLNIDTGKDFSSKKCSSANKDACNRDNNSNIGFEFKIK